MPLKNYTIATIKSFFVSKEVNLSELSQRCLEDPRIGVQKLGQRYLADIAKAKAELERVKQLAQFDAGYGELVAGVDEVGRGPLAGPIVGAAVIMASSALKDEDLISGINDSKALSPQKRRQLAEEIRQKALSYAIYEHSNVHIDTLGLSFCNNDIFLQSLKRLSPSPKMVLSDGFYVKDCPWPNVRVIKGDAHSYAIACASILAKVYRDDLMAEMADRYPGYGFERHVGYGCKEHCQQILALGPCPIHRQSFLRNLLASQNEDHQNGLEE